MKTSTSLALAFVVAAAAGACAPKKDTANPEPTACTEEAKVCPDGSSVGREGPNCEFAACPGEAEAAAADDEADEADEAAEE
jgi:hypothetical protein